MKNYNNPHGVFSPLTGEYDRRFISASFANQDGTGDPATCDTTGGFWDSAFAANLATSLGTVGAAAFGAKTSNPNAPKIQPPKTASGNTPPPPATKSKTIYWVIGISSAVLIIGGVAYAATRKK